MRKLTKTLRPFKNRRDGVRTSSAAVYIAIIFAVALMISLISFRMFWNSPTRDLVVKLQKAKEEPIENPFLTPVDQIGINVNDGILTKTEVKQLIKQIDSLTIDLKPQEDFRLKDEADITNLLEF